MLADQIKHSTSVFFDQIKLFSMRIRTSFKGRYIQRKGEGLPSLSVKSAVSTSFKSRPIWIRIRWDLIFNLSL
jgi:hypothetical protein